MWPDERIVRFVNEHFLAARVHPQKNPDDFKRYGQRYSAQWTPIVLLLDSTGAEHYRIEGFLPTEEFLGLLMLGWARMAFDAGQWDQAERRYREIVERLPDTDAAAEALYWAGVAPYKATGNPASLKATGDAFKRRYTNTAWAKKASVWS